MNFSPVLPPRFSFPLSLVTLVKALTRRFHGNGTLQWRNANTPWTSDRSPSEPVAILHRLWLPFSRADRVDLVQNVSVNR